MSYCHRDQNPSQCPQASGLPDRLPGRRRGVRPGLPVSLQPEMYHDGRHGPGYPTRADLHASLSSISGRACQRAAPRLIWTGPAASRFPGSAYDPGRARSCQLSQVSGPRFARRRGGLPHLHPGRGPGTAVSSSLTSGVRVRISWTPSRIIG
jgi:hypothetical protein